MPVIQPKIALTIAGSDSSGGAGIQSDIKTFYNLGVYGINVITAITSQNSKGVRSSFELPEKIVKTQLKTLLEDYNIQYAKIGMVSSDIIIKSIVACLKNSNIQLIVDPVILSKNKYLMLNKNGIKAMIEILIPKTYLLCPNLQEASVLTGIMIHNADNLFDAAKKLKEFGAEYVLLKGGHFQAIKGIEPATDILYDGKTYRMFFGKFVNTIHTHGTGCVYSAAVTANLINGFDLGTAINNSKKYLENLLLKASGIGKGIGPVEQTGFDRVIG